MKVLVRAPNAIGDAVMAIPAVRALSLSLPGAEVVVATRARTAPLWEMAEVRVKIEVLPGGGALPELRWALQSRGRGFFVGATFAPSFQTALFLRLAGCASRVGFESDGRGFLLTRSLGLGPDRHRHLTESFAALASEAVTAAGGSWGPATDLKLPVAEPLRALARQALPGAPKVKYAALAPGAEYGITKRWPADRFVAVATRLRAEHGWRPVFLGSPAERDLCGRVAAKVDGVNLAGDKGGLRMAAAVLAECELFVGNDSGLAHLAAAVGTPAVAVFGSTSPAWTAPRGRRVQTVTKGVWCSPCFRSECPFSVECLTGIHAEEVLIAAEKAAA